MVWRGATYKNKTIKVCEREGLLEGDGMRCVFYLIKERKERKRRYSMKLEGKENAPPAHTFKTVDSTKYLHAKYKSNTNRSIYHIYRRTFKTYCI